MTFHEHTSGPSDADVRKLLVKYHCPTPFHAVRTVFLGRIASPQSEAGQPMAAIERLWGGLLPAFDNEQEVQLLADTLVGGLWNPLTVHQDGRHPFQLTQFSLPNTDQGLRHFADSRLEELNGFVDGLFGDNEEIELPERAHQSVNTLRELCAMFYGLANVEEASEDPLDIEKTAQMFGKLTPIAETEINEAVLSCARARHHALQPMMPPT